MIGSAFLMIAATALTTAAPAAGAQSEEATGSDRVVCKTVATIGSRMGGKRTCKTVGEWAELKMQTRGQIEKMQKMGAKY